MRIIKIGEKEIGIRASTLALLYYRQEFKVDLLADMTKLEGMVKPDEEGKDRFDLGKFDFILMLQIMWAMAKAAAGPGKQFPQFEKWVADDLADFDFTETTALEELLKEAAEGFFRQTIARPARNGRKTRSKRKN